MNRGRVLRFLGAAALLLLVVSCGDDSHRTARNSEVEYSVDEVTSAFTAVTERKLRVSRPLDLRRTGGGVSFLLRPGDEERAKYGEFRFVVQTVRPRDPVFDVISRPGDPEIAGHTYLVRRTPEGRLGRTGSPWAAWKFIGNVKLTWFTDSRKLDDRWAVLDQVLERLKRGGQPDEPAMG